MRRLVRQYGRSPDSVFPSGGTYGSDESFPVPFDETANPNSRAHELRPQDPVIAVACALALDEADRRSARRVRARCHRPVGAGPGWECPWVFGMGTGIARMSSEGSLGFDTDLFGPVEATFDLDPDDFKWGLNATLLLP